MKKLFELPPPSHGVFQGANKFWVISHSTVSGFFVENSMTCVSGGFLMDIPETSPTGETL